MRKLILKMQKYKKNDSKGVKNGKRDGMKMKTGRQHHKYKNRNGVLPHSCFCISLRSSVRAEVGFIRAVLSRKNRKRYRVRVDNLCLIFVGYGQSCPSFSPTRGKYLSSVFRSHSGAESVFVFSLSVRGLKCSFHTIILFHCDLRLFTGCKINKNI